MTKSTFDKLSLSKNERYGLYFLLSLFVGFIILPYKFSQPVSYNIYLQENLKDSESISDSSYNEAVEMNINLDTIKNHKLEDRSTVRLIEFDPNELNQLTASQLGISTLIYKRIQNYLKKGARFKSPEQFGKIYGLTAEQYETLHSYIKIKNDRPQQIKTKSNVPKIIIEINKCNTSDLLPLPGIGEGLSNRIIKYRNLLGGFYKTEQLKEVYGITDSLYLTIKDYIEINKNIIKLKLSEMKFDELQKHPYIGYKMAKLISAYVRIHPQATNQEILANLPPNGLEITKSILPYLELD